jgi:hypothetical protein
MTEAWWLFWNKGMFPSAKAKNSENWEGYHDLLDVIEQLMERQVDTSKRTP